MAAAPFEKQGPDVVKKAPERVRELTFRQRAVLFAGIITLNLPVTISMAGMAPPARPSLPGSRQAVVMSDGDVLRNACMPPGAKETPPTMNTGYHKGNM